MLRYLNAYRGGQQSWLKVRKASSVRRGLGHSFFLVCRKGGQEATSLSLQLSEEGK